MKKFLLAILSFAVLSIGSAIAQEVRGEVVDQNGSAIPGAGVTISGTTVGTITGIDGTFTISAKAGSVLIVSSIGYTTAEINVGGQSFYRVVLNEDKELLDEVVVIGYGTVRKRDLTGSVSSVRGKDIQAFAVANPVMALQGRVPGVVLSQNTGDPAGDYSIRIRGVNSIKGNNDPLFIIDGIPQSTATINTYDVESMEILKDASATAIYGSRGANGVVLITTKKGASGKPKVTYDFEYGINSNIKKMRLMDAQEYMQFYNEYLVNANILDEAPFSQSDIANANKGVNTDWQDLIFRNAPQQNHNLSISGGNESLTYNVSLSAMMKDGLIYNSAYDKYNLRSSLNIKINPIITTSIKMSYTLTKQLNQSDNGGNGGSSMIGSAYSASPLMYPYDEDGNDMDFRNWEGNTWISHEIHNPMNMIHETKYQTNQNIANINGSIDIHPFKGFNIKSTVGFQQIGSRYDAYVTSKYLYGSNSATVNNKRSIDFINENIMTYDAKFGNGHKINVMAGYTYEQYNYRYLYASGSGFLGDTEQTHNIGAATTLTSPTTSYSEWVLMSGLARLNYNFKDRYLLTVSFRADGSSRYSKGQKWGFFPSAAFAWNIREEPFMKNVSVVNALKLRLGYGQTGSTAINAYSTQTLLSSGKAAIGTGTATYYAPPSTYPGDLKWETTSQYDAGVDLAVLDSRLKITADVYYKLTTDLLNNVSLPTSSGYSSTTKNIGSMSNAGIELLVEGEIIKTRDWGLTSEFNIAHNRNRVEKLADGLDVFGTTYTNYGAGSITIIREGEPLGAFYLFKCNGLNENGTLTYEDFNGDGAYTDTQDRYIAGSPFPLFTTGLNLGLRYKNWDFNFFLQGSVGGKIYNLSEMRNYSYSQGMNIEADVYKRAWKEGADNSNAWYPKITNTNAGKYSDRFLEDGSYLRLKNIQLAYNFRFNTNWIQSLRIYASMQNYLTLTKYSGVDPEVSSKKSDTDSAIDHLTYPNSKTVSMGLNLTF